MQVHNLVQGSPEWLAVRAKYFTASEAPIMLGVSRYQTRSDLLKQKATGVQPDVDTGKQRIFDKGHAAEAAARPFIEAVLGEDLYPCTGSLEVEGLPLLASFDGLTMDESTAWEHKLLNASLLANVQAGDLEPHYWAQLEQQMLVSGATKVIFTTSDGTEDNAASMSYASVPERRAQLITGWKQFAIDLAAYVPAEVIVPATAAPQIGLPSVSITVNGSIALVDNLDKFGTALTAYIEKLNRKPETDQDFADLEDAVKRLKAAEDMLDSAEAGALGQTESIDTMRRTVALHRETARTTRLLIDKLVKAEKENRRTKIISDAVAEFHTHMAGLNARLGKPYMPTVACDFQGVVKGLKSLDSMKDKVATELARCKIEANAAADRIQANLAALTELASDHKFLFADTAAIVLKANDDLMALVKSRIADHKVAEEKKEAEQRERIRAEEVARLAREQTEKDAAELKATEAAKLVTHETVVEIMMPPTVIEAMNPDLARVQHAQAAIETVAPMSIRAALAPTHSPVNPPDLKLGQIADRLGFTLTADFLKTLGFEPAATDRASKLYHNEDFPLICKALIEHIESVCELQAA